MQRSVRGVVAMVAVIALSGCAIASTARSYNVESNGLERGDQALRDLLANADGDPGKIGNHGKLPGDALLRALYEGTLAYYAGDYTAAVRRFETAYQLSEDRYTKSLSRGALSLVINDRALEYLPGENERLFIHYYAALSYLKKHEPQEAAVEARRLVYQLQRLDEKATPRDQQTRAMLRYFAGAVFEAAGDRNDALVAYRNAALALGDTAGARQQTLTPPGETLVIVEQGFVAHRVNQSIWVELGRNETQLFVTRDDEKYRRGASGVAVRVESSLESQRDEGLYLAEAPSEMRFDAPLGALDSLAADLADSLRSIGTGPDSVFHEVPTRSVPTTVVSLPAVGDATRVAQPKPSKTAQGPDGWIKEHILKGNRASDVMAESPGVEVRESRKRRKHADRDDIDRLLRVSLPAFHRTRPASPATVMLGDSVVGARVTASLSEAVIADYARQRNAVLTRAVARAATRYALNTAVEKKAKDKWGETTGDIVGFFAQATGAALERADTRSWHLLPERVSIVRLRHSEALDLKMSGITYKPVGRDRGPVSLAIRSRREWTQRQW